MSMLYMKEIVSQNGYIHSFVTLSRNPRVHVHDRLNARIAQIDSYKIWEIKLEKSSLLGYREKSAKTVLCHTAKEVAT